jgi:hypothetical protein
MATVYDLKNIFSNGDKTSKVNDDVRVIDKEWVMSRFMTPSSSLEETIDKKNRFNSSTSRKFTDTSWGGNLAINCRPQFTRYCDLKGKDRMKREEVTTAWHDIGGHGMGRYYSESIDDNQQFVFLEFGLPKFNGLIDYFTRAIDYEDSVVANTGRSPIAYKIGKIVGGGLMLAAFPLITVTIWVITSLSKLAVGNEPFSYYYLEPAMHLYWGTVNTIVTNLATEMGILMPELMASATEAQQMGIPVKITTDDIHSTDKNYPGIGDMIPGLFSSSSNYIDVFMMATRAQAMANSQQLREKELADRKGLAAGKDYMGYVLGTKTTQLDSTAPGSGFWNDINARGSFMFYINHLKNLKSGNWLAPDLQENKQLPEQPSAPADATGKPAPVADPGKPSLKKNENGTYPIDLTPEATYLEKFAGAIDSTVRDGGMYAVFAVDYVGSVSESFSNSVGEISSGQMLKQVGGRARDVKFNLAGGNLTNTVEKVLQYGKDMIAGALDSVTFGASSVLATLTGGGFIDLPKKWEDSDSSFPSITYNIQLISPYGNALSQLQNMYIPLAMLLAGTLPLATGKASYTSPFLCRLYNKGVQKINMGMITSLSITRGTSNLGFNKQKRPLAIDVSFTVTDFSSLIAAPVNSSVFDVFNVSLEDNTPLSNYIATLASRDINTDKYIINRLKMKASRMLMNVDQAISPSAWGMRTGENLRFILGGVASDHALTLSNLNAQ